MFTGSPPKAWHPRSFPAAQSSASRNRPQNASRSTLSSYPWPDVRGMITPPFLHSSTLSMVMASSPSTFSGFVREAPVLSHLSASFIKPSQVWLALFSLHPPKYGMFSQALQSLQLAFFLPPLIYPCPTGTFSSETSLPWIHISLAPSTRYSFPIFYPFPAFTRCSSFLYFSPSKKLFTQLPFSNWKNSSLPR